MKKRESEFLAELEERARRQKKLVGTEILPTWARGVGEWLVVNPWRVLIPLSIASYYLLRTILGAPFRELVLAIFGGFS